MCGAGFNGRFYEDGGVTFSLFSRKIKEIKPDGKISVVIRLDHKAAANNATLRRYNGADLVVHGMELTRRLATPTTTIAFGSTRDSGPTASAKLACFRNSNILIAAINAKIAAAQGFCA